MASFSRDRSKKKPRAWRNSPRKAGIPGIGLREHLTLLGKRDPGEIVSKQVHLSEEAVITGRNRPEWLHPDVDYERNPFTRAYTYFYEGQNTLDERLARQWSKAAHVLAEKRARVKRENRAYLKRQRGNADLAYPHAVPDGHSLDPTWQHSSSLQYTPASGTAAIGANMLSVNAERGVQHLMAKIGHSRRAQTGQASRRASGGVARPSRGGKPRTPASKQKGLNIDDLLGAAPAAARKKAKKKAPPAKTGKAAEARGPAAEQRILELEREKRRLEIQMRVAEAQHKRELEELTKRAGQLGTT
jgi:hypothetical protein